MQTAFADTSLRVGIYQNQPKIYLDEKGKPAGFFPELLNHIAQQEGWTLEYVPCAWSDCLEKLEKGELDLMPDMAWSEERTKRFGFGQVAALSSWSQIYSRQKEVFNSLLDLDGKRIAVLKNSFQAKRLAYEAKAFDIHPVIVPVDHFSHVFMQVEQGTVDAGIVNRFIGGQYQARYKLAESDLLLFPSILHFATPREKNSALLARLDEQIVKLKGTSGSIYHHLQQKLFAPVEQVIVPQVALTDEEKAWIEAHPVIRVGVDHYPPFEIVDGKGNYEGMGAEYLNRIGKGTGLNFKILTGLTWEQVQEGARNGEVDVIPVITNTEERRKFLHFTEGHLLQSNVIITRLEHPTVSGLADLKGKTIAVSEGYSEINDLNQRFPTIKQVVVRNPLEELKLLASGKVDACQGNLTVINYYLRKYNLSNLKVSGPSDIEGGGAMAIGSRKDWPILHSILDKGLKSISESERLAISRKWAPDSGKAKPPSELALTIEEREWLERNPVLRLGYDIDWPPVEYANEQEQYQGMSSEYMALIAEMLGVNFEPAKPQSWRATIEAAKGRQLDILSAITRTPQREEYLLFTTPYLSFPMIIVTDMESSFIGDINTLQDNKIAVVDGYASHDNLKKEHPNLTLLPVVDIPAGLRAVQQGEAKAFVGSLASVSHIMGREGISGLKISGEMPYSFDLSVGIRKDQPVLAGILQKALNAIPEAQRTEIFNRWVSITYQRGIDYTLIWEIVGVSIVVIFLFIIWNLSLKRNVARRTADLRKSEEKFRILVESTSDWIWAVDENGIYTYASPSVEKLLGYTPEEVVGRTPFDLMSPDEAERVAHIFSEMAEQRQPIKQLENTHLHKDGHAVILETNGAPIYDSNHNYRGYRGVDRDITERKRMQGVMVQTEKMMSVGGLAAGMAHELNNPLGGVLQGLQNIQRRISPTFSKNIEEARELGLDLEVVQNYLDRRGITTFIQQIAEAGTRASDIVSNMLKFARKPELQLSPVQLSDLVDSTLKLASMDYDLKKGYDIRNIEIVREYDPSIGTVPCIESEIQQVLLNLLRNAAQALHERVESEEPSKITVRIRKENTMVCVDVEDNGPGMDEATREKVFEPFFTTKSRDIGTGLGLSVSYFIVTQEHQGNIGVHSTPGRGATFTVCLPSQ